MGLQWVCDGFARRDFSDILRDWMAGRLASSTIRAARLSIGRDGSGEIPGSMSPSLYRHRPASFVNDIFGLVGTVRGSRIHATWAQRARQ